MSGGYFDYKNSEFDWAVVERIEEALRDIKDAKAGIRREDKDEDLFGSMDDYYEEFSQDVVDEIEKGLYYCKVASIYAHRIDWLLSNDDGPETFLVRLKEDLNKLEENKKL